jgi:polyhydroxyalkanoate synthesis regulator phasin
MTDEIDDLRETVESLRERIEDLEDRIDTGENETAGNTQYDQYDRYVLDRCEDVVEKNPRSVMRLYDEAGVHDKKKQKQRTKRLKRLEK